MTLLDRTLGRRTFLMLAAAAALPWADTLRIAAQGTAAKPTMTVYKSPTCGCCTQWVAHMQANGFVVKVVEVDDPDTMSRQKGVPNDGLSCHIGLVDNYVVEGHVPADAVHKMLKEKPAIVGLTVPGMPMSAPGMYTPGGPKEPYTIMAIEKGGKMSLYQKREGGS
jgi:hypothetical protein